MVLVGNKVDLVKKRCVRLEEPEQMAKTCGSSVLRGNGANTKSLFENFGSLKFSICYCEEQVESGFV